MKRLHIKFIKWLSNKFGYKIVMLKAKNGIFVEGDMELLKYVDASGYFFNKEPLRRLQPSKTTKEPQHIKKLSKEQLKEIGLA